MCATLVCFDFSMHPSRKLCANLYHGNLKFFPTQNHIFLEKIISCMQVWFFRASTPENFQWLYCMKADNKQVFIMYKIMSWKSHDFIKGFILYTHHHNNNISSQSIVKFLQRSRRAKLLCWQRNQHLITESLLGGSLQDRATACKTRVQIIIRTSKWVCLVVGLHSYSYKLY